MKMLSLRLPLALAALVCLAAWARVVTTLASTPAPVLAQDSEVGLHCLPGWVTGTRVWLECTIDGGQDHLQALELKAQKWQRWPARFGVHHIVALVPEGEGAVVAVQAPNEALSVYRLTPTEEVARLPDLGQVDLWGIWPVEGALEAVTRQGNVIRHHRLLAAAEAWTSREWPLGDLGLPTAATWSGGWSLWWLEAPDQWTRLPLDGVAEVRPASARRPEGPIALQGLAGIRPQARDTLEFDGQTWHAVSPRPGFEQRRAVFQTEGGQTRPMAHLVSPSVTLLGPPASLIAVRPGPAGEVEVGRLDAPEQTRLPALVPDAGPALGWNMWVPATDGGGWLLGPLLPSHQRGQLVVSLRLDAALARVDPPADARAHHPPPGPRAAAPGHRPRAGAATGLADPAGGPAGDHPAAPPLGCGGCALAGPERGPRGAVLASVQPALAVRPSAAQPVAVARSCRRSLCARKAAWNTSPRWA